MLKRRVHYLQVLRAAFLNTTVGGESNYGLIISFKNNLSIYIYIDDVVVFCSELVVYVLCSETDHVYFVYGI